MFNQLTQRKQIPGSLAPLRIRQARHADAAALERLASLDSSHAPRGDVLIAEVGDELWAAFSLEDGHHIADPLRPSADAVLMLAQRGRQLRRDERRHAHGRARVRFA
jgi:hypothetical protein